IAVREAETALAKISNLLLRIIGVLVRSGPEDKGGGWNGSLETRQQGSKFMYGLEPGNRFQIRLDGGEAQLFRRRFIHTCGVKITDLLGDNIAALLVRSSLLQNATQEIQ